MNPFSASQMAAMTAEPAGKHAALLKPRLATPALLTWSSDRAQGACLSNLLKETSRGDQVSVLIAKSDLANAPQTQALVDAQTRFVGLRIKQNEHHCFDSHLLWHREILFTFKLAGISFLTIATFLFFGGQKKEEVP